jgi:hypothetical protein
LQFAGNKAARRLSALISPLFLALTAVLWEDVARKEAETLVTQRQATALAGVGPN